MGGGFKGILYSEASGIKLCFWFFMKNLFWLFFCHILQISVQACVLLPFNQKRTTAIILLLSYFLLNHMFHFYEFNNLEFKFGSFLYEQPDRYVVKLVKESYNSVFLLMHLRLTPTSGSFRRVRSGYR